jgi:hypothetical protein
MRFLSLCTSAHAEVIALAVRLGARRRSSDQNRCSERPTRGHPARLGSRNPTFWSKPVRLGLLQEARAKLARQQVQSERPGLPAGAFALCGVRTAFCDKGLRARRSRGVGQGRGAAGALADRRGRLGGLSLGASRDSSGVGCLCLTLTGAFMSRRSKPRVWGRFENSANPKGPPWRTCAERLGYSALGPDGKFVTARISEVEPAATRECERVLYDRATRRADPA